MTSPSPAGRGWVRVSVVFALLFALLLLGSGGHSASARVQWSPGARLTAGGGPFSESVAQMRRRDLQWRAQVLAENLPPSALANPAEPWEGQEEEEEREREEHEQEEREGRPRISPPGQFFAASSATPQSIGSAFQGFGMQDQINRFNAWSYPPDTTGAVGPNHFVQIINGSVSFYNKSGVSVATPVRLNTFFTFTFQSVAYPRNGAFDPRVLYDRASGRWYACALEFGPLVNGIGSNNHLLLAISRSSDPTTIWDKYVVPVGEATQTSGGNTIVSFSDYPTLGMDSNGVYAAVRIFKANANTGNVLNTSAKIVATPKAALVAASPALGTVSQWSGIQDMFSTPQPALNTDPVAAGAPAWFFASNLNNANLTYRRLTWSGGTPQLSSLGTLPAPAASLTIPSAPANGSIGAAAINTGDARLQSATTRNGRLWTSRNICVNASGGHTGASPGDRVACEWFEIDVTSNTAALVQNGRIWDPAAGDPWFYYFPDIMVNGQGHAVVGFSGSKNSEFVSAFYAGRLATDPAGTMGTPSLIRAGSAPYVQFDLNNPQRNRWGDYSYTTLDPSDDMSLWTLQEYAEAPGPPIGDSQVTSRWGTRVARIASPAPTLNSPDAVLDQGQSNVTLQLSGTGFYDPGTGFPNRLQVQVGGGSPTGIDNLQFTYNGPASITLHFDVAANAGGGPRSITVTNPDGQSAAAAMAFSIGVPATTMFSAGTYTVPETGGDATIQVNRIGLATDPFTVDYASADGTATAGTDYTAAGGLLTFAGGQTSQIFTVPVAADRLLEGPETVTLTVSNAQGALLGSPSTATLTINDDTAAPAPGDLTATVAAANAIVLAWMDRCDNEDGVQVERKAGAGAFALLTTTGAEATGFTDPGPFLPGTLYTYRVRTVRGAFRSDYSAEADAVVTTIQFGGAAISASEVFGAASIQVFRSGSTAGTSTAQVTVTGGTAQTPDDFLLGTMTVSFGPSETVATIPVTIAQDALLEPVETVTLTLSNPDGAGVVLGARTETTLNIEDGPSVPAPTGLTAIVNGQTIELSWVDHCENETGFEIRRRAGAGSFELLETVGADVTSYPDINISRGVEYTYFVRAVRGALQSGLSNTATAALDGVQFGANTYEVTEAGGTVQITVTRTGNISAGATVDYLSSDVTAAAGSDYTVASGTLTFAPGQASRSFALTVANDEAIEGDETLLLSLLNLSGGEFGTPATASVVIHDNRAATKPTGVTATPTGAGRIRIGWTEHSTNETGFRVERSPGGGFSAVGVAPADAATFDDLTAAAGTSYLYRVVAVAGAVESDPSDTATASIPTGGKLKVSPGKLNFGKLKLGRFKQLKLKLTNSGKGSLAGLVGGVNAPFQVVSGQGAFTLAPKKSLTLLVRYDAAAVESVETVLTITSTDPARSTVSVPVTARGK